MGGNSEFIEFLVKVPTTGKDGRDLTGDRPGPGGLRRDDGTLSAQAYDFQRVQRGKVSATAVRPQSGSGGTLPPWAINAIEQALVRVGTLVAEEVVIPATKRLWRERLGPALSKRRSSKPRAVAAADDVNDWPDDSSAVEAAPKVASAEPSDEVDARDEDVDSWTEMGREEADWHAEEARQAFERFMAHVSALRNARVVDDEDIAQLIAPREELAAGEDRALEVAQSPADTPVEPLASPAPRYSQGSDGDAQHGPDRLH